MNNLKSWIEKDKFGSGYWLIIEHEDKPIENTMMAITEEEVPAIMEACREYLLKDLK
jgi:hypothetical protein